MHGTNADEACELAVYGSDVIVSFKRRVRRGLNRRVRRGPIRAAVLAYDTTSDKLTHDLGKVIKASLPTSNFHASNIYELHASRYNIAVTVGRQTLPKAMTSTAECRVVAFIT